MRYPYGYPYIKIWEDDVQGRPRLRHRSPARRLLLFALSALCAFWGAFSLVLYCAEFIRPPKAWVAELMLLSVAVLIVGGYGLWKTGRRQ